jgi:biotin synthase
MRGHRPEAIAAAFRGLLQESKPQYVLRRYGTVSSVSAESTPPSVFSNALDANAPRHNWTREEIKEIYDTPLMNLAFAAVRYDCMTR